MLPAGHALHQQAWDQWTATMDRWLAGDGRARTTEPPA
ncbi:MAG: hypothetical protein V7607_3394 [Solirubrobacteraceae bacterium]